MNQQITDPERTAASGPLPEDIPLDEAGRNWVNRKCVDEPARPLRRLAADAAVTSAICQAYGCD